MNERPTPETDAAIKESKGQWSFVLKETCQRLERERDEAREALRTLAEHGENEIQKLIKERDETREVLAATKHYLTKERDDALSQIIQAECRAERFCQERDEARIAIIATLEENRHLADGDDCTLAKLKSVVPNWK